MKLGDIDEQIQKLNLPQDQKNAILDLIDAKVDNDMKEVILEMRGLKNELKSENASLKNELKSENQILRGETEGLRKELKLILWFIGAALTVIAILLAMKN